jgi:hypothetical protein
VPAGGFLWLDGVGHRISVHVETIPAAGLRRHALAHRSGRWDDAPIQPDYMPWAPEGVRMAGWLRLNCNRTRKEWS